MLVVSGFSTQPMTNFLMHVIQLVSVEDDVNCLTAGTFMNDSSINILCKLAGKLQEEV